MASSPTVTARASNRTDALINGIFIGILGGLIMLLFLMLADFLAGTSPIITLQRFSVPGQATSPVLAGFLHLGVSAVYGGIFGLILYQLPGRRITGLRKMIAGLIYGLLLYLLAITLLLPSSGSALLEVPPLVFGTAHAIYGLVLGKFAS
jgi:hypothetical protein